MERIYRCKDCGRKLYTERSRRRGLGDSCALKWIDSQPHLWLFREVRQEAGALLTNLTRADKGMVMVK